MIGLKDLYIVFALKFRYNDYHLDEYFHEQIK